MYLGQGLDLAHSCKALPEPVLLPLLPTLPAPIQYELGNFGSSKGEGGFFCAHTGVRQQKAPALLFLLLALALSSCYFLGSTALAKQNNVW